LLPAAFVVTLLPDRWRGNQSVLPWIISAAVAALVSQSLASDWAMLIGGAFGTGVSMMRRDDV
jgi:predicted branched-subunit amino acid permease